MHIDIAVVLEGCGDGEACSERATKRIDMDVAALALVLGKHGINVATVEIETSDVAFERYVVSGLRHRETILHHEVTAIIIWPKRHA